MGRYALRDYTEDKFETEDDTKDESDEEELPHPIPFQSALSPRWGKTRFGPNPLRVSDQVTVERRQPCSYATLEDHSGSVILQPRPQRFPSIAHYFDSSIASSIALMEYSHPNNESKRQEGRNDDDIDTIRQLFSSSLHIDQAVFEKHSQVQNEVARKMTKLAESAKKEYQKLEQWNEAYRQKIDQQHKASFDFLRDILKADHEAARAFIQSERQERKLAEEMAKRKEEIIRQEQDALQQAHRQAQEIQEALERKQEEQKVKESKIKEASDRKHSAEMAYVAEARSMIDKLVDVRAEVEPFDSSSDKAVSKRRMHLKKMCRGRVNTLAADVNKIQSVASELIGTIKSEKELDEQWKQHPVISEEAQTMTKGYLYAMDLLASSAVVRIQAEGFNGPRGDGFPLASFLAIVTAAIEDFAPIFEAHLFSVCPTAIPTLPQLGADATEVDLKESLGMAKKKDGEFESFERFLHRTEGIVSIVANIMSSHPSNHVLFGGHKSAIVWLQRFLALLPPMPEQLPLITAPVLDAFLTGAGHMLANLYVDDFKSVLDRVETEVITRLDEGSVGAPSALRLKQTMGGGFEGFQKSFPSRALTVLYNDGKSISPSVPNLSTNPALPVAPGNPFVAPNNTNSNPTPFSGNPFGQSSKGVTHPFGGQSNPSTTQHFRTDNEEINHSGMDDSPSGFVPDQPSDNINLRPLFGSAPSSQSSFGTLNETHTPFGSAPTSQSLFGTLQETQTPFGSAPMSQSPFGSFQATQKSFSTATTSQSPFGTFQSTQSPFGTAPTTQSPFGTSQAVQTTPFGSLPSTQSTFGALQSSQTPFNTQTSTSNPAFGQPATTPFGGGSAFPGSSTTGGQFGGNNSAINPSPFGSQSLGTSIGNNMFATDANKKGPCKFFAQGNCRNGDNCRFSHVSHPNGVNASAGFAAGTNIGSNPFGGPRR